MGWTTSLFEESADAIRAPLCAPQGRGPGNLQMPDLPLVRAIFHAFMAAGPAALANGWSLGPQGASHATRAGGQSVTLRLEAASAEDAERVLTGLSPLLIDALALLMDVGAGPGRPSTRVVRVSDVAQAKGSRRWGDERRNMVRRLSDELQALRRLSFGAAGNLLFDLTPIDAEREAYVYRPGAWLCDASVGRCDLDRRLLQLDHRPNRGPDVMAKKLGVYFSLLTPGEGAVVRPVNAVLRAIGAADPHLASRRGRGGRLAERFDEALLRLAEQGLFAVRYRGGDATQWGEDRSKGRVKRWAAAELVIRRARRATPAEGLLADWR